MIDPNIILQSQTPTQMAQGAATLAETNQNLQLGQQRQQLNSQALDAGGMENQQRQMTLEKVQALNSAISQNVKSDGSIDHQAVMSSLAQRGQGAAALDYRNSLASMQANIAKATSDQLATVKTQHDLVASSLGAVLNADPSRKQAMWTQALQWGQQQGLVKPGQYPDQVPPDDVLRTLQASSIDASKQVSEENAKRLADASDKRADAADRRATAAEDRETTYQQSVDQRADQEQWQQGQGARNGHSWLYNKKTGEERIGGPIDATSRGANGVQGRANDKQYNTALTAERKNDEMRTRISGALSDGSVYVAPNGTTTSFEKLIPQGKDEDDSDYAKRFAERKSGFQADMKLRFQGHTSAANAATISKNDAIVKNGNQPDVSNEQAIAARGGGQTPAPQKAAGPNSLLPSGNGRQLDMKNAADVAIAKQFITAAGGDKQKARTLAKQNNFSF